MYFFLSFIYCLLSFSFDKGQRNILELNNLPATADTASAQDETGRIENLRQYDSAQNALPADKRDGVVRRWLLREVYEGIDKSGGNQDTFRQTLSNNYKSNLPQVIFFLMPLVALLLKFLYLRKNIYLTEHMVFTLHMHCFVFLLFILLFPIRIWLPGDTEFFSIIAILVILVYLAQALRVVYKQKWGHSIAKLVILSAMYTVLLFFGLVVNAFWALIAL